MLKNKMLVVSLGVMMLCLMSGCGTKEKVEATEHYWSSGNN